MGTYYLNGGTRKEVIAECIRPQNAVKAGTVIGKFTTLAHCCVGNNLWTVQERAIDGKEPVRFICLYALTKSGGDWGYKPMDESCGPYYYSCPLSYLDMAVGGDSTDTAKEWRKEVRNHWKAKDEGRKLAKTLKVGETFENAATGHRFEFRYSMKNYVVGRGVDGSVIGKTYRIEFLNIRKEMPAPAMMLGSMPCQSVPQQAIGMTRSILKMS